MKWTRRALETGVTRVDDKYISQLGGIQHAISGELSFYEVRSPELYKRLETVIDLLESAKDVLSGKTIPGTEE